MPMTSYPARVSSAAATDESTPPDIATTTRAPASRSRLAANSAGGIEPHLPESGFEPGGRGEVGRQQPDAALAAAQRELLVERRGRLAGQLLVLVAGIHVEPFAVRGAVARCRRVGV